MRKLYTVAFPNLSEADARLVEGIRASHDRQAHLLGPHFTLLFGCDAVDEAAYLEHVRAVAAATSAFRVESRDAEPDSDDERGYAYLVPTRGRAELDQLHDRLYTGPMAPHLRKDRHFVAHITVGHCATFDDAQRLCDELDADGIDISATIDALVVGCVEDGAWVELARFALRH
jgi:2'-5' RNA ligase